MRSDVFAYRASQALTSELRQRLAERREFVAEVIVPWDMAHPEAPIAKAESGFSCDSFLVGFLDVDRLADPPEGLSRAQTRDFLIPVRGKTGRAWREALAKVRELPRVDPVLRSRGVPTHVFTRDCRVSAPGILMGLDAVYLTYLRALQQDEFGLDVEAEDGRALTLVPLSVYYAAREAAEKQVVEAGRG